MHAFQEQFIKFILEHEILQFGEFTLKSGRKSHYFFNAGKFNTGFLLAKVGEFYAQTIVESGLKFDVLFGPAYKGIPLATAAAIALSEHHKIDIPYAFNRKEIKDHGEGGDIVGSSLKGHILMIDDVITAGTAIRQSIELIGNHKAIPAGVVIALDREEKGEKQLSAIEEIEQSFDISVISIIKLSHIKDYLRQEPKYISILNKLEMQ